METNEYNYMEDMSSGSSSSCETIMQNLKPNLVKNIMRSFFNFMVDKSNQDLICELVSKKPYGVAINSIKKFIKNYKFNNMSLFKVIKHQHYKKVLEYYLTFDICEWLNNSKITDLDQHRGCIEALKDCCVDISILEQLVSYKKLNL